MSEKAKPQEEEGGEGAPLWIISFADMISLLMAFFVMLSTFSSFGPRELEKIRTIAKLALRPDYGWHSQIPQSALTPTLVAAGEGPTGSERPTLESTTNNRTMKEEHSSDYRNARVFTAESSKIFLAKGQALSSKGREVLDMLASYLEKAPGQIVIFEKEPAHPPQGVPDGSEVSQTGEDMELSIARSVVVLRYFQSRGIPKERCNISSATMLEGITTSPPRHIVAGEVSPKADRQGQLEIVLADELESE